MLVNLEYDENGYVYIDKNVGVGYAYEVPDNLVEAYERLEKEIDELVYVIESKKEQVYVHGPKQYRPLAINPKIIEDAYRCLYSQTMLVVNDGT